MEHSISHALLKRWSDQRQISRVSRWPPCRGRSPSHSSERCMLLDVWSKPKHHQITLLLISLRLVLSGELENAGKREPGGKEK